MTVCYTAPQSLAVSLFTTPSGRNQTSPEGVVILDTAPLRGAVYTIHVHRKIPCGQLVLAEFSFVDASLGDSAKCKNCSIQV